MPPIRYQPNEPDTWVCPECEDGEMVEMCGDKDTYECNKCGYTISRPEGD